jgi:hypothetical protein
MKKRTFREAAIEALKRSEKPLDSNGIYEFKIKNDSYRFKAANPENIVNGEIRRHCIGVKFPTAKPDKVFQILIDGSTLVDFMIDKKIGVDSEDIPVYINALDNSLTEETK